MKKKPPITFLIILFFTSMINAQQNEKPSKSFKNAISIFYTPTFGSSNIKNYSDVFQYTVYFRDNLFPSEAPSQGVWGYSFGFSYQRQLKQKLSISLGFRYNKRGQKSPDFFEIQGIPPSSYSENYGGSYYKITYESYEFPLLFSYRWKAQNKFNFYWTAGLSADVFSEVYAQNYILDRALGEFRRGCCTATFSYSNKEPGIKRFFDISKKGLIRTGLMLGANIEYVINPHISFSLQPEFWTRSNFINEFDPAVFSIKGWMYDFGITANGTFYF